MIRKPRRIERELTDDEREVLSTIGRCCRELDDLLAGARRRAQKSSSVFVTEHIANALHRGIEAYFDMFERLKVDGRRDVDRLLGKHLRLEEFQDMADEIAETEGYWRNFIANLERELDLGMTEEEAAFDAESADKEEEEEDEEEGPKVCPFRSRQPESLESDLEGLKLIDPRTSRSVKLTALLEPFRTLIVLCLPAYLPYATMRWQMNNLDKMKDDLSYFRCGVIGVTWGLKDHGKKWSKEVKSSFPIYLDSEQRLIDMCGLTRGLHKIWGAQTLMHLAELQRRKVLVDLPPENVKWEFCLHLGCTMVLGAGEKKGQALKTLLFHRSKDSVGDLPSVELLRKAALDHFCAATGQSAETVVDSMDRERRYRRAPDAARLQLEPSSGMYYDPATRLYYDPRSQYYYDGESGQYVYWNEQEKRYVSAQHMYAAGPSYYQVRALIQQQEADIYAKAVAIVDARESGLDPPTDAAGDGESDLKPPGT